MSLIRKQLDIVQVPRDVGGGGGGEKGGDPKRRSRVTVKL